MTKKELLEEISDYPDDTIICILKADNSHKPVSSMEYIEGNCSHEATVCIANNDLVILRTN